MSYYDFCFSSTHNQTTTSRPTEKKQMYRLDEGEDIYKEVENTVCTAIVPKNASSTAKEQEVSPSFFPSYMKSYSQTRCEVSTFDYTWKIDQFGRLSAIVDTLSSPPFGDKNQYTIQMNILRQDSPLRTMPILIRTDTACTGSCITTIMYPPEKTVLLKSISCLISDMTLLIEVPKDFLCKFREAFIIRCEIEICHELISNTIHMNLQPSITVLKEEKSLEDSTLEFASKNEKSIKFVVGDEQYVISKKLLCATNSSYFKILCLTIDGTEKDMTKELTTDELQVFEQILLYILTGSIQRDYDMLKPLLTAADKYDVQTLKLTCEHYLLRYITIKNAVELIQLAFSSTAKFLETHSVTFIKFHIKEIANTKEFQSLSKDDLNKILELIEESKILEISTLRSFLPSSTTNKNDK